MTEPIWLLDPGEDGQVELEQAVSKIHKGKGRNRSFSYSLTSQNCIDVVIIRVICILCA
jgi:hypothetical protein